MHRQASELDGLVQNLPFYPAAAHNLLAVHSLSKNQLSHRKIF